MPSAKGLPLIRHVVIRANPGKFMPTQPRMIAVVDDDPSMLKGIERLLGACGFATKVFSSAEAFIESDGAADVDCLLLDIHLGGMSGIELRRHLAVSGSPLPVIFMTAFDDEATRTTAQSAGCTAYLQKPFVANLLISAIRKGSAIGPIAAQPISNASMRLDRSIDLRDNIASPVSTKE